MELRSHETNSIHTTVSCHAQTHPPQGPSGPGDYSFLGCTKSAVYCTLQVGCQKETDSIDMLSVRAFKQFSPLAHV